MESRPRSFPEVRGLGGAEDRAGPDNPYSAASYAAQYGVPREDVEDALRQYKTHGEVKQWIYREYLSDEDFREASLNHETRPYA